MSLAWRDLVLTVAEIKNQLLGSTLHQVYYPLNDFFVFDFKGRSGRKRLAVSLVPTLTGCWLTQHLYKQTLAKDVLSTWMKTHLRGKSVQDITLDDHDRRVALEFKDVTIHLILRHSQSDMILTYQDLSFIGSYRKGMTQKHDQEPLEIATTKHIDQPTILKGTGASVEADHWFRRALFTQKKRGRLAELRKERKRIERTQRAIEADIIASEQEGELRMQGDALKMALFKFPKNARLDSEITVENDGGKAMTIANPKRLSAVALMKRLYNQAKKQERKRTMAQKRKQEVEHDLQTLEDRIESVAEWTVDEHWADVVERAHPTKTSKKTYNKEDPSTPAGISVFKAPSGERVMVGKNAMANEKLLKLAKGKDVWLHAREVAGAHVVILRTGKAEVSENTVRWAAELAVKHSKAKNNRGVDVIVANRCDVKKVKGGHPGQVTVSRSRTVYVKERNEHRK